MDRGEGVKPQEPSLNVIVERESENIVCVGGLDTNDEEEVGEYYDGGMSSGYLDDRTGLELDGTSHEAGRGRGDGFHAENPTVRRRGHH